MLNKHLKIGIIAAGVYMVLAAVAFMVAVYVFVSFDSGTSLLFLTNKILNKIVEFPFFSLIEGWATFILNLLFWFTTASFVSLLIEKIKEKRK